MPGGGNRGILFMLVGPGGVGKNVLMKQVLKRATTLQQLPTATTRAPREGEVHGIHHFFISLKEFQHLLKTNALLEYQEVHPGKFYGVPRMAIEATIEQCEYRIADIEFKGAEDVRNAYPENTLAIFIAPPAYESLLERMTARGSTQAQIDERLVRAPDEMLYAPTCDYVIVNDTLDAAADELCAIIQAEADSSNAAPELCNKVSFAVEVIPQYTANVLYNPSIAQKFLQASLPKGNNPQDAALRTLEQLIPNAAPENLRYGTPDETHPVRYDYAPEQHTYALTYRFTYTLPEQITPPEGWVWGTYNQVTAD